MSQEISENVSVNSEMSQETYVELIDEDLNISLNDKPTKKALLQAQARRRHESLALCQFCAVFCVAYGPMGSGAFWLYP